MCESLSVVPCVRKRHISIALASVAIVLCILGCERPWALDKEDVERRLARELPVGSTREDAEGFLTRQQFRYKFYEPPHFYGDVPQLRAGFRASHFKMIQVAIYLDSTDHVAGWEVDQQFLYP